MPELIEPALSPPPPLSPPIHSYTDSTSSATPRDLSPTGSSTVPAPPPTTTITWLDWDDTCLPTRHLTNHGWYLTTDLSIQHPELVQALRKHEQAVYTFLSTTLQHSNHVSIITNAETGWVNLSAAKFMPSIHKLLLAHNVDICSARSTYEHLYPDAPAKWKYFAMQTRLDSLYRNTDGLPHKLGSIVNVICIGDSHAEREAANGVVNGRPYTWLKTVKFIEQPSLIALTAQLDKLGSVYDRLVLQPNSLRITMGLNAQ